MSEHLAQPVAAASDAARLQRLAACRVNNANREPLFDQLVADAARLLAAPVAVLGFLDADREWVKAAVGWNVISLPGQYSLAARLLHERETTVVSDMSADPDGRLLHVNEAVLDALRMRRDELINRPLADVVEPAVRDDFRIAFAEVIAAGEAKSIETVFVTSTGKRITVEGSVHPKVIEGRSVLARVIFRDITERIEFESEL